MFIMAVVYQTMTTMFVWLNTVNKTNIILIFYDFQNAICQVSIVLSLTMLKSVIWWLFRYIRNQSNYYDIFTVDIIWIFVFIYILLYYIWFSYVLAFFILSRSLSVIIWYGLSVVVLVLLSQGAYVSDILMSIWLSLANDS